MKKFLSMMLTAILVLSMSTVAFAAETTITGGYTDTEDNNKIESQPDADGNYVDTVAIDLKKVYKLTTENTSNPAEIFTFKVENFGVTDSQYTLSDMPSLEDNYTISFNEGEATKDGDINTTLITLPEYEHVGIFTYKFTEEQENTAGVTYDANALYLKVTVIEQNGKVRVAALHYETEDGSKTESFTNTYSAGSLEITKTVTGNMGEKDRYFEVTVTLTGEEDKEYAEAYTVTGGSYSENPGSIAIGTPTKFYLKDGETITIANLPYNVTYAVKETDYTSSDSYDPAEYKLNGTLMNSKDEDGNIVALESGIEKEKLDSSSEIVAITNNKGTTVDTGITLDSAPYMMMLIIAAAGIAFFLAKKRRYTED